MPQQSLLPDMPAMTSLSIEIRSYPHTPYPDEVDIEVSIGTGGKPRKTVWAGRWRGYECDYLNTLVEDVASTYMYGETRKDVKSTCAGVAKLARRHATDHQF